MNKEDSVMVISNIPSSTVQELQRFKEGENQRDGHRKGEKSIKIIKFMTSQHGLLGRLNHFNQNYNLTVINKLESVETLKTGGAK